MSNPQGVDALATAILRSVEAVDDDDFATEVVGTATGMIVAVASAMSLPDRKKMAAEISSLIINADVEALN